MIMTGSSSPIGKNKDRIGENKADPAKAQALRDRPFLRRRPALLAENRQLLKMHNKKTGLSMYKRKYIVKFL